MGPLDVTSPPPGDEGISILLVADEEERTSVLEAQLSMALPRATYERLRSTDLIEGEGRLPRSNVSVVDGPKAQRAAESLRLLRARGFVGPMVVVTPTPDESPLQAAARPLGAVVL